MTDKNLLIALKIIMQGKDMLTSPKLWDIVLKLLINKKETNNKKEQIEKPFVFEMT